MLASHAPPWAFMASTLAACQIATPDLMKKTPSTFAHKCQPTHSAFCTTWKPVQTVTATVQNTSAATLSALALASTTE